MVWAGQRGCADGIVKERLSCQGRLWALLVPVGAIAGSWGSLNRSSTNLSNPSS